MRTPALAVLALAASVPAQASFVNWETPQVSPIDRTPDGTRLLVVNTPDNRLEVLDLRGTEPVLVGSVRTGLDPVSVRARSDSEAWVVNHVSDSISIVDLTTLSVRATLRTDDEPADVVFAGEPQRAFVTCSQANRVLVFDPTDLDAAPAVVEIDAEDPRALAVSPSGDTVYAAVFESGNGSTTIAGSNAGLFRPMGSPSSPYGGVLPIPNDGFDFEPPQNPLNPPPPRTSLIVRKTEDGRWMDDNIGDWTELVSGSRSLLTEREPGWDLPDRDLAIIDAASLEVRYARRLMNLNMAMAVHPRTGRVSVVGTEATNEVRFEPNITGTFVRVVHAVVDPSTARGTVSDLNPHLDYDTSTLPQTLRDLSVGDPRGMTWNADGTRAYITGMGSNNVVVIDESGVRVGDPIEVGEGPTGVVFDAARERVYVLNRFGASLSVLDADGGVELHRTELFDPTPEVIRVGRRHLYDTHETSGLGQVACASCHVDARMDRLAWDLGDPSGEMLPSDAANLGDWNVLLNFGFDEAWHPMKGPMLTQTLQDIIGKEPLHWRGDRPGLESFNGAFVSLQGDDEQLTVEEMQEYEAFLSTIHFPPNPYRNLDNSLPTDVPMTGFFSPGGNGFGQRGDPLPNGNAQRGVELFTLPNRMDSPFACSTCHTLPTGVGPSQRLEGGELVDIPPGPNGEGNAGFVSIDGDTQRNLKVPHLRNLYERTGFDVTQRENRAGFGYHHDGSFDSLPKFFRFGFSGISQDIQVMADIIAFMLAFSGSDLPEPAGVPFEPLGPPSQDTHAAVGQQVTLTSRENLVGEERQRLATLRQLADGATIDLVASGRLEGRERGFVYLGQGRFQTDELGRVVTFAELADSTGPGSEVTFMAVPTGAGVRIGVDRDEDGLLDGDDPDPAGGSVQP